MVWPTIIKQLYTNIHLLGVACPPERIHPNVMERGIHIHQYGIERRPQNFNQGN